MSGEEKIVKNGDFSAARTKRPRKDSTESNSSSSEAEQSTQPPPKKIKVDQLEQPSVSGTSGIQSQPNTEPNTESSLPAILQNNSAYEALAIELQLPNNITDERTLSLIIENCLLNSMLNKLNKLLEYLRSRH